MISAQRVLSGLMIVGLLNLAVPISFAADKSLPSAPQASPVVGTVMTRASEEADWKSTPTGGDVTSHWFKTDANSQAVIAFAGDVHMRMAPNTVVYVDSSSTASLRAQIPQGDVLTTVPLSGVTSVQLTTPKGTVSSSTGSFIVNVDDKQVGLEVLEGNARLNGKHVSSEQLPGVDRADLNAVPGIMAVAHDEKLALDVQLALEVRLAQDERLALDGPDVRQRKKTRKKFTQGEQSTPKRLGEDAPPTVTTTPTPPPVVDVPPIPPDVPPTPPDTTPPPTVVGDDTAGYLLGGGALIGLIFLGLGGSSSDSFSTVQGSGTPASP